MEPSDSTRAKRHAEEAARRPDVRTLSQLAKAFAEPRRLETQADRRRVFGSRKRPWQVFDDALTHFVVDAIEKSPGDETRRRLLELIAGLHLRPSLCSEKVMHSLGIHQKREAILQAIDAAFPATPLIGRPLAEATLDDEKAFRKVPAAELAAARAGAEVADWRKVDEADITNAFEKNSVYVWLDRTSLPFYLPACLAYSLQNPASQCEIFTCMSLLEYSQSHVLEWTGAQRQAIARFLEFVADDGPGNDDSPLNRQALALWWPEAAAIDASLKPHATD